MYLHYLISWQANGREPERRAIERGREKATEKPKGPRKRIKWDAESQLSVAILRWHEIVFDSPQLTSLNEKYPTRCPEQWLKHTHVHPWIPQTQIHLCCKCEFSWRDQMSCIKMGRTELLCPRLHPAISHPYLKE